jgi:hypothetical protein
MLTKLRRRNKKLFLSLKSLASIMNVNVEIENDILRSIPNIKHKHRDLIYELDDYEIVAINKYKIYFLPRDLKA